MQLPLNITFRNMRSSPVLESHIREKVEKLERMYEQIISCRVYVEAPHRHHQQGNIFQVRVELGVPGDELVVSRERRNHPSHEDVYVALRDSFDALRRQLEEYVDRRRKEVKCHGVPAHGRVIELDPTLGSGRIRTADEREVYFHRNSLIDGDFDTLRPGSEVRFSEEVGEHGPQASTVRAVGKHHPVG
jgi:ribosomal subunit interface protein